MFLGSFWRIFLYFVVSAASDFRLFSAVPLSTSNFLIFSWRFFNADITAVKKSTSWNHLKGIQVINTSIQYSPLSMSASSHDIMILKTGTIEEYTKCSRQCWNQVNSWLSNPNTGKHIFSSANSLRHAMSKLIMHNTCRMMLLNHF